MNAGALMLMGASTRLSGKPFLVVGGKPLFRYGFDVLEGVFGGVLVSCEKSLEPEVGKIGVDYVCEEYGVGPMGGFFAGFSRLSEELVFVAGCDMPFLNAELIKHMLEKDAGSGVAIVEDDGRCEPLHALYPRVESLTILAELMPTRHKLSGLIDRLNMEEIPVDEIRQIDPELASLANINTPGDLTWMKERIR